MDRVICFGLLCFIVFCHVAAPIKVYQTCKEIKDNTPVNLKDQLANGYFFIQLQSGIGVQVYCYNMASNSNEDPIEYINLPAGRSQNFAEFYRYVGSTSSCTLEEPPEEVFDQVGKTEFDRVRFDTKTRSIITNDFMFSTNVGSGNSINYGTAGDKHSYQPDCDPLGKFAIDLTGTPWIVNGDITWKWEGTFVNGDSSKGSAIIDQKFYLGCYIDQQPRDLPENVLDNPGMTGQLCSQHCRDSGFEYAGTQYRDECFCGHTYGNFGKANETDCNMPCAGDSNEMCGGTWRNSVYHTGKSQTVRGNCGGYPGNCYPTLNYKDEEKIKIDVIDSHPCLQSPSPCYNDGVCIAADDDQFLCLCHTGYVGTYCELLEEPQRFTSPATASSDDANAYVSCPPGMIGIKCECEERYCDGTWFVADECQVTNSGQGKTSKSVITCVQHDPSYQRMVNVESTNYHNPTAQCPERSIMTGCAAVDPWFQQVTYGRGVIDNSTTPWTCKQDYCKDTPNGCRVQARCLVAECDCRNGGTCVHASGFCACPTGYYGSKCESFDYCAHYEDVNNQPPCLNGGTCVGVPSHVIATTGGTGNNKNCEFPFVYQTMSYSKCVDRNEVGPPFACGAVLDGVDSYIDFGQWNPGPIYTMEVWARALEIQDGRRAIAGGFGDCRDWGIGLEGGRFKAFYDPPDSCTAAILHDQPVNVNQWYYLTKTSDGQTAKFYVNGYLVGSATIRYMTPGTSVGFYAGGEECCGNFFNGEIKSLRVWKRVLSENEITTNYGNEHGYHDSSKDALQRGLVGHWDFGETTHPPCVGVDHMGADWSVDDGEVLSGVHCNITRFFIPETHTVSVREWDGTVGTGKVEIYAKDIDIYGTLTANGKGYKGGESPSNGRESGFQGESFSGNSDHTISANIGGGGGGGGEDDGSGGHGKPGGGGGYGAAGGTCKLRPDKDVSHCGEGGSSYGDDKLSTLHLGSGGGSGGNDNSLSDNPVGGRGGNGGGAIRLDALRRVEIVGYVQVDGAIGQGDVSTSCDTCPSACTNTNDCKGGSTTSCYDFSGAGGGGSGGSLYLRGQIVNVGINHISANGGRGGHGAYAACGGDGSRGRIRIDYEELIGKYPSYTYLIHYDSTYPDKSYVGQQEIDLSNTNYGNEVYLGCHEDQDDRHMEFRVNLNSDEMALMTPDYCVKRCREEGYKYSGTQFSNECYCDNDIGKFPRLNEGACTMTCAGDNQQICGDSLRLTVYGPPPTHGAATEKNGVIQTCKPWCVNGDHPSGFTWGECVNDGFVSEYEARCECKAGYSGRDCGQFCPSNTWGEGCLNTCDCVEGHTSLCDPVNGECVCHTGYEGDRCQYQCASGMWGNGCANTCSCVNSDQPNICDAVTGQCDCHPGFTGVKCDSACPDGKWGSGCLNSCNCQNGYCSPEDGSCSCSPGFTGTNCDQECTEYTWGNDCMYTCNCNGHTCDSKTGACVCPPTATGTQCENGCPPGKWGSSCVNDCNCGSHSLGCETATGKCVCEAGYTGTTCESDCPIGKFGIDCAYSCSCDINNIDKCHPETGQCECKPGYEGVQCHSTCPSGKWGILCSMTCLCDGTAHCDPVTGSCDSCPIGFVGENCQDSCPNNHYGERCQELCNCNENGLDYCDGVTGFCYCKAGYYGTTCQYTCDFNQWGPDCAYSCACVSQNTASCEPSTGTCICQNGYQGQACAECTSSQCTGTGCNCHNHGTCSPDGTCTCAAGYYGANCDNPCPNGKYGINCESVCSCQNGASCDKATGVCTCTPGFHGPRCEYVCTDGYYGQNCALICQCVYGQCNSATGSCTCDAGFTGSTCSESCGIGKYGPNCNSICNCDLDHSTCDGVSGECLCAAGYTGSRCSLPCSVNYFGEDCQYTCPTCGSNAEYGCDAITGACVCKSGYQPPYCSDPCSEGFWGPDCSNICTHQCRNGGSCDSVTGNCNCAAGYYDVDCSKTCVPGYYGPNCVASCHCLDDRSQSCDSVTGKCSCNPGFTGDICESPCPSGSYGSDCQLTCTCQLTTGSCDPVDGSCNCNPGYGGSDCSQPCASGTWGKGCQQTCLCSHFSSGCDPVTGDCTCLSGYTGPLCEQECPEGFFGSNCASTCSCRNEGVCDHKDGYCQCQPGFTGTSCESSCGFHTFGYNCAQMCSCDSDIPCDPVSGVCLCPSGWSGPDCSIACGSGFWGQGCGNQCPTGCPIAGQCDIVTGYCICPDGLGGKFCNESCPSGKWGPDCVEFCFSPCLDECDTQTGDCFCGSLGASCKNGGTCKKGKCQCVEGYGGQTCTEPGQEPVKNGPSDGVIAAAVIVSILVAVIIGLVVYMVYYKRSVNLSLDTLKSLDVSKIFSKQEDEKSFYSDAKVTIENPNYNFDDTSA